VERVVAVHFHHETALYGGAAVDLRVHVKPPHAREILGIHLIEVRERPAQAPDRLLAIDRLHRLQKRLDAGLELRMHV
jgi:hypothetical protein